MLTNRPGRIHIHAHIHTRAHAHITCYPAKVASSDLVFINLFSEFIPSVHLFSPSFSSSSSSCLLLVQQSSACYRCCCHPQTFLHHPSISPPTHLSILTSSCPKNPDSTHHVLMRLFSSLEPSRYDTVLFAASPLCVCVCAHEYVCVCVSEWEGGRISSSRQHQQLAAAPD